MARPLRTLLPDGIYHVTTRGVARGPIFVDDADRLAFLGLLASVVRLYAWRCHAFCLMTNHYHLIVETSRADLSDGLQRLNGRYAQEFNVRYSRSGHLFGGRFASWLIEEEDHLHAASEYVLGNPVRAGLCSRPEEWRWSGYARAA